MVGGQAIGHIESIESVLHGGANPLAGEVGTVAIVALDEGQAWKVPRDADIFVSSRGILSERYLEVAPPGGEPGPPVTEGAELRAADPPSLDTVLGRTWANMAIFRRFVAEVSPELDALGAELDLMRGHLANIARDLDAMRPLIADVGPLTAETRELLALARATYETSLGGAAGMDRFTAMTARARTLITQARAALELLAPAAARVRANTARVAAQLATHDPLARAERLLANLRATLDKLEPLLAKLEEVRGRLARGEGSLGRLMTDPEFPEDAKELGKILKRRPWRVIAKPRP